MLLSAGVSKEGREERIKRACLKVYKPVFILPPTWPFRTLFLMKT